MLEYAENTTFPFFTLPQTLKLSTHKRTSSVKGTKLSLQYLTRMIFTVWLHVSPHNYGSCISKSVWLVAHL